jgi:hypothetical protein
MLRPRIVEQQLDRGPLHIGAAQSDVLIVKGMRLRIARTIALPSARYRAGEVPSLSE